MGELVHAVIDAALCYGQVCQQHGAAIALCDLTEPKYAEEREQAFAHLVDRINALQGPVPVEIVTTNTEIAPAGVA